MLERRNCGDWNVKCDVVGCTAVLKTVEWCHVTAMYKAVEKGWKKYADECCNIKIKCPEHAKEKSK